MYLIHHKYWHVHDIYAIYWIFDHIFYILMKFYKFCSDYNIVLQYQILFDISSTIIILLTSFSIACYFTCLSTSLR